jgi:hypothetical protein
VLVGTCSHVSRGPVHTCLTLLFDSKNTTKKNKKKKTRSLRDDITWVQFTAVCVESDVEVSFLKLMRDVMKEHAMLLNDNTESEDEE